VVFLPVMLTVNYALICRWLGGPNHWYLPVAASFAEAEATALLGRLRRSMEIQSRS
jgi:hypothetical protein